MSKVINLEQQISVTCSLLLHVAGFLNVLSGGYVVVPPHVQAEAHVLLEKLGKVIAKESDAVDESTNH